MTELEVLAKLTYILKNDAIADCKINNPEGLKSMQRTINELLLMNNISDIYWYLVINFQNKRHKDWELWKKCKYRFEVLPNYIENWLGMKPNKLTINDIKINEIITRKAIYARTNKYHQVWSWLIDKDKIIFYNQDNKLNKWMDLNNINVQIAELDEHLNLLNYKGVDRYELQTKIMNGTLVYIFDSIKPYLYKFKGVFVAKNNPTLDKEINDGVSIYRKRIQLSRIYSQFLNINSNDIQEKIFIEGELTKHILDARSRKNIREEYIKSVKNPFICKICGKKYKKYNSDDGIIEIHHLRPIHYGVRETTVKDVIGLCPNCHRWVHTINDLPESLNELIRLYNEQKK